MIDLIEDGPVERYLAELFDRLAGTGAAGRRSLVEAEDHLREAVATRVAAGAAPEDAEREAVVAFGSATRLGMALQTTHRSLGSLLRMLFVAAWWGGIVGALALGVSGLVSEAFGRLFGAGFVAGDTNGVTYTPARCADYLEYFPHAASCNTAAALHHWGEVVEGRVALGVLGLIALVAWLLVRRKWTEPLPPAPMVALAVTVLAGLVAVVMLGLTTMEMIFGQRTGVGASLADGSVAALVAIAAGLWGFRRYRRPRVAIS